jgi:hypothetical protein
MPPKNRIKECQSYIFIVNCQVERIDNGIFIVSACSNKFFIFLPKWIISSLDRKLQFVLIDKNEVVMNYGSMIYNKIC